MNRKKASPPTCQINCRNSELPILERISCGLNNVIADINRLLMSGLLPYIGVPGKSPVAH
jgi:hypothetical protein